MPIKPNLPPLFHSKIASLLKVFIAGSTVSLKKQAFVSRLSMAVSRIDSFVKAESARSVIFFTVSSSYLIVREVSFHGRFVKNH